MNMVASLGYPNRSQKLISSSPTGVPNLMWPCEIEVVLLTGCGDRPYVFGLAKALASEGVHLDVVGGNHVDRPELHAPPRLNFLNLRGEQRSDVGLWNKVIRVLAYYVRLVRYASVAKPKIFHILWNNKFQLFDRTVLMLYYKLQRKKIVFTAHNVNAGKRDGNDSLLNRISLRIQYYLADHIFVHTEKMKTELLHEFRVKKEAVTVIPFGINNAVPNTSLSPATARQKLGISKGERLILFFGNIEPYKGLEFLVTAFQRLVTKNPCYRLIIAGQATEHSKEYFCRIQQSICQRRGRERVIQRIEYIPDEENELYFKAADVLALPYTHVFQSGVLFLGYSFGLPVVATKVGSLEEEILEGRTGFLCEPRDSVDLARAIEQYFESDLYKNLNARREEIREFASQRHSWETVGHMTRNVYSRLFGGTCS